jgi:hypothetical protein
VLLCGTVPAYRNFTPATWVGTCASSTALHQLGYDAGAAVDPIDASRGRP